MQQKQGDHIPKTHRSRNRVRFKLKLKKDVFRETNPDITLEQILTK